MPIYFFSRGGRQPATSARWPPGDGPVRRDACLSLWYGPPCCEALLARFVRPAAPRTSVPRSLRREQGGHPAAAPTLRAGERVSPDPGDAPGRAGTLPGRRPHPPAGEGTQQYMKWSACHEKGLYHRPGREDL